MSDTMREVKALLAEISEAGDCGDDPRYARATDALRLIYGLSIAEPRTENQHFIWRSYSPFRPTESELKNALALVANLVTQQENKP